MRRTILPLFVLPVLFAPALVGCGKKSETPDASSLKDQSAAKSNNPSTPGSGNPTTAPGTPDAGGNPPALNATGGDASSTGLAPAPAVSSGPVTLRLKLKKGDKIAYTQSMTMAFGDAASGGMKMASDETMEVTGASANGLKAKITISGMHTDTGSSQEGSKVSDLAKASEGTSVEADYDLMGHSSHLKVKATNPMAQQMGGLGAADVGFMGIVYPEKAVGVGSNWSTSLNISKLLGAAGPLLKVKSGGQVNIKYQLKRFETIGGKTAAVVEVAMSGKAVLQTPGMEKNAAPRNVGLDMAGTGTYRIDTTTGAIIDKEEKMDMTMDAVGKKQKIHTGQVMKRKS